MNGILSIYQINRIFFMHGWIPY